MNDKNIRYYDMFGTVTTFGRDNAEVFDAKSMAAAHFAQLAAVIIDINQGHADTKGRHASVKKVKIETLRAEMKNLARTAREIELAVPGTSQDFRMPKNGSQVALLAAARKMVTALKTEGVLARFVAFEVSGGIVTELEGLLAEIEEATDENESDEVEGVENTAAINLAIARGKSLVDSLDAAVRNKFKNNPAKLAAWETASHIDRAPRRKKLEAPAPAGTAG